MKLLALLVTTILAAPAFADCPALPNADKLLTPGARIFVGEVHGTNETQRAVGALVCLAAKKGPVRVGLEITADEEPALAAFLASAGTPADRAALLRGAFWTDKFQDGRRSRAMAQLIDDIRALRHAGADLDIATFDEQKLPDRDRAMADRALAAIARAPKATWILYAGNLHARKATMDGDNKTTFMAMHLVAKGVPVVALNASFGAGSAWICTSESDCGPHALGGGSARPVGITLGHTPDGAYDGVLEVGAASYSPPAAVPMTREQQTRAASLGRQLEATAAYRAKKYDRCGELGGALAKELRSADQAYNAACCWALAGKVDSAFTQLALAVELGFSDSATIGSDTDLTALHADARWQPLVARVAGPSSAKK
jgi:hypothetical protein